MIDKLITIAKEEGIPDIDVSGAVLARIRVREAMRPEKVRVMSWTTGIAAIAASIIMFFAFQVNKELNDPLMQYFAPIEYSEIYFY